MQENRRQGKKQKKQQKKELKCNEVLLYLK
jgi:hypothetical protein